jgi:hypothetical protein
MSRLRRGARWTPPPPADDVASAAAEIAARLEQDERAKDAAIAALTGSAEAVVTPTATVSQQIHGDEHGPPPGEAPDPAAAEVVDGEAVPARRRKKPEVIPHPVTGEAIAIVKDTATNVLAELRSAIVDHERSVLRRWKRLIDDEIRDRLDEENVRTATVGPSRGTRWKVTVPAPTTTEWDGEAAYKAVRELVRQGLISATAAGRCVERVVEYKPKHNELKKLADHADERVRAAARACRTIAPVDDRRVTVTPIRTGRSERDDA